MFEALIFDFDGLILDTELPEYQVWQEIFHDSAQTSLSQNGLHVSAQQPAPSTPLPTLKHR